jgi:hypothetical protein
MIEHKKEQLSMKNRSDFGLGRIVFADHVPQLKKLLTWIEYRFVYGCYASRSVVFAVNNLVCKDILGTVNLERATTK